LENRLLPESTFFGKSAPSGVNFLWKIGSFRSQLSKENRLLPESTFFGKSVENQFFDLDLTFDSNQKVLGREFSPEKKIFTFENWSPKVKK
jgi:hypothetical protein